MRDEFAVVGGGPKMRRNTSAQKLCSSEQSLQLIIDGNSLLATPKLRQNGGEVVERRRQIGRERLGPRPRQPAIKIGRLLRRRQRLLAPPKLRQPVGEGVERH